MPVAPLVPRGEALRHAIAWLAAERDFTPARIEEACRRFDVDPADEEFLLREFGGVPPGGRSPPPAATR